MRKRQRSGPPPTGTFFAKRADGGGSGIWGTAKPYARAGLHPILFGVYPVISLYFGNFGGLSWRELVAPLALIVVIVLGAELMLFGVLKRPHRTGFILSCAVLFFFYGNQLPDVEARHSVVDSLWIRIALALGLWFACTLLVSVRILRMRRIDSRWTLLANRIAVILILAPLVFNFEQWWTTLRKERSTTERVEKELVALTANRRPAPEELPDIYFIVLDSYGRADALREFYDFENDAFLDALNRQGFVIAPESHANYAFTHFVFASVLNLNYLHNIFEKPYQWSDSMHAVKEARLLRIVESLGYEALAFPDAEFAHRQLARLSPYHDDFQNNLAALLLKMSPLEGLVEKLQREHRGGARIRRNLGALARIAKRPEPTFVFMHVMAPHHPFDFRADGTERRHPMGPPTFDWATQDYTRYRRLYAEELAGLNTLLLKAIDDLLRASPEPPVIVLFGDHGPRPQGFVRGWRSIGELVLNPSKEAEAGEISRSAVLREWMPNFHAAYLPGHEEAFYPQISPVNAGRLVLSEYLDLEMPLLEDRVFFTPDSAPRDGDFEFHDITADVLALENGRPDREVVSPRRRPAAGTKRLATGS